MADSAPVERAFLRGQVLARMVEEFKSQALRHPENEKWADCGITDRDDNRKSANAKLIRIFEEIAGLVEHLTILDMTASYELAARTRLGNYIGTIKNAGEAEARTKSIPRYSLGVIRNAQSYDGIAAISDLLKSKVDSNLISELASIGKARNKFAHGTNVKFAPEVNPVMVKEILVQALDAI